MFHTASTVTERGSTKWPSHAAAHPCENIDAVAEGRRADVLNREEQATYLCTALVAALHCEGLGQAGAWSDWAERKDTGKHSILNIMMSTAFYLYLVILL